MQKLNVVNQMLATMGEAPLNSLEDDHTLLGACLSTLDDEDKRIQTVGWWFNTETVTLNPMVNQRISVPGDTLLWRSKCNREIIKRGDYLYNRDGGTPLFTDPVEGELIRRLDFEILDEIVAAYIAACAVQKFQRNFDADNNRKQDLNNDVIRTRADLKAEGVRQSKTNLIYNNLSLARLRSVTRGNRRYR